MAAFLRPEASNKSMRVNAEFDAKLWNLSKLKRKLVVR
jgi:hypothetical protein